MEPMDTSDNGSGESSVSTELSERPNGATDLKKWADADDPRFYPRSQDHPEPVPEPLRVPYPPSPQFGPPVLVLPARPAPSKFHPTNEEARVHPHGPHNTEFQASSLRVPYPPSPQFGPPVYHLSAQAPSSVSHPTNEEVRVHPRGAQITELQASFTAPPANPNIPRLSPLEGPREVPRLLELIPTSPGSDFPRASPVAGTLPGMLRPPPAPTTTLELMPIRPTFNVTHPVASRQQGEQAPQQADPEHRSDAPSDTESHA